MPDVKRNPTILNIDGKTFLDIETDGIGLAEWAKRLTPDEDYELGQVSRSIADHIDNKIFAEATQAAMIHRGVPTAQLHAQQINGARGNFGFDDYQPHQTYDQWLKGIKLGPTAWAMPVAQFILLERATYLQTDEGKVRFEHGDILRVTYEDSVPYLNGIRSSQSSLWCLPDITSVKSEGCFTASASTWLVSKGHEYTYSIECDHVRLNDGTCISFKDFWYCNANLR